MALGQRAGFKAMCHRHRAINIATADRHDAARNAVQGFQRRSSLCRSAEDHVNGDFGDQERILPRISRIANGRPGTP